MAIRIHEAGHKVFLLSGGLGGGGIVPGSFAAKVNTASAMKQARTGYDCAIAGVGLADVREALHTRVPTLGPSGITAKLQDGVFLQNLGLTRDLPVLEVHDTLQSMQEREPRTVTMLDGFQSMAIDSRYAAKQCLYQEVMPNAQRACVTGFFNGHSFVLPVGLSQWFDHVATGSLGPRYTQPMGSLGQLFMKPIRLFKAGLEPLTSILRKADFRGWLGALVQFNDKQVRVERILTDACLFTQFLDGIHDIAKPIMALATGGSELGFVPRWYGTLLLANAGQALAVGGLCEGNMKHLLLHGVVQTEHGYFATEHGSLGYVTAWGLTASEVHRRLYRTAKTVRLAGMVYRTDIKSQGAFHKMLSHDWL